MDPAAKRQVQHGPGLALSLVAFAAILVEHRLGKPLVGYADPTQGGGVSSTGWLCGPLL